MKKNDLSRVKITYDGCFPPMFIVESEKKGDLIYVDDTRNISEDESIEIINKLSRYLLSQSNTNQILLVSNQIEIIIKKKENINGR